MNARQQTRDRWGSQFSNINEWSSRNDKMEFLNDANFFQICQHMQKQKPHPRKISSHHVPPPQNYGICQHINTEHYQTTNGRFNFQIQMRQFSKNDIWVQF